MDESNQNPKQALVDKLKDSKNILVTVTTNPNVDQLAACLGLTIWLNKIGKHATAVFSGEVPSTLEFLQPDETLEKNTDSLRDFIISLDKSKADKLRYKVEDSVVKVFVTPYRTSLTADDLEFSQGDFNVDLVIALGVHNQNELDASITAHGRILHDATVATITVGEQASELGSIGWHDGQASSLSELVVDLVNGVDQQQLDEQIATALLTGVVAETERFSNDKTTPQTMSVSAQLMSAGANQQLVANKLDEPAEPFKEEVAEAVEQTDEPAPEQDGSLSIDHEQDPADPPIEDVKETAPDDEQPELSHFAEQEPEHGGTLTANSQPEDETGEPTSDPMSQVNTDEPLLDHTAENLQPAPPDWMPPQPWMAPATAAPQTDADFAGLPDAPAEEPQVEETPVLDEQPQAETEPETQLPEPVAEPVPEEVEPEQSEPEVEQVPEQAQEEQVIEPEALPEPPAEEAEQLPAPEAGVPDVDAARDEVMKAVEEAPEVAPEPAPAPAFEPAPEPIQALNALPIDLNAPEEPAPSAEEQPDQLNTDLPNLPNTEFNPSEYHVMNDPEVNTQPLPPVTPDSVAPAVDPNQPVDPDLTGPVEQPFTMPLPGSPLAPPPANPTPPTSVEFDPMAPPPVPPPLPPMPPKQ